MARAAVAQPAPPGCGTELVTATQRASGRCPACPPTYDEALYERLVAWRRELSKTQAVPAFVVFTDATLEAIAEAEPKDTRGLLAISGVGARKLDQYGEDVLAIVAGREPSQTP